MSAECGTNPATTDPDQALAGLCETYRGNAHRLLRDLADRLQLALAYVDRATVEAHLERAPTAGEWESMRGQFSAMDFDDHVGDQGTVRTRWVDAICERAGTAGRNAPGRVSR